MRTLKHRGLLTICSTKVFCARPVLLVQNGARNGSSKLESFSKLNIGKGLFSQKDGARVVCPQTTSQIGALTENAHLQADLPSKLWADFNYRFMK